MVKHSFSERRFFVIGVFIFVGLIFVGRLFYLQIIDDRYKAFADNNALRKITDYPARGLIYDRNGKELVLNEAAYDLMVIPRQIREMDTLALCRMISISKEEFDKRLKKAKNYSWYKASTFDRQISKEAYGVLQEKLFRFPGFFVQARTIRKYPHPIAAHTLGYTGEVDQEIVSSDPYYVAGDYIGWSGLEKAYEEELRGTKGFRYVLVDVHNREQGSFENRIHDTAATPGLDLFTSLDMDLQHYAETLMMGKRGGIAAIDPKTGEILCMVTSPTYDPNMLVGKERGNNYMKLLQDKTKPLFNRAVNSRYPPGSTFKMANALVALQENVLTTSSKYGCPGGYSLGGGRMVRCHAHSSPVNIQQSIQVSCNTFYCKAFKNIIENPTYNNTRKGFLSWRDYMLSFGFGKQLETDIPNVGSGNIPTAEYYDKYYGKNRWRALSIISLSIGQGEVGTSPLQLANYASIIANRGYYYPPHIVRAIGEEDRLNPRFKQKQYVKVDSRHFDVIYDGMRDVVLSGTATYIYNDSLMICGKTGTAQNPHGENHSVFIAFAPATDPKIAIAVVVENAGYGGTWAAPISALLMEKYIFGKACRPWMETNVKNKSFYYP